MISALALLLAIAFVPQQTAHAEKCYDADKQPIPCPKSDYALTQEALKSNLPSQTPVPPSATAVPATLTLTHTPIPPTPTSTETETPEPVQAAAAVIPPAAPDTSESPSKPLPLLSLFLVVGGGAGLGTILFSQRRRRRNGAGKPIGAPDRSGAGPDRMFIHRSEAPRSGKVIIEEVADSSDAPHLGQVIIEDVTDVVPPAGYVDVGGKAHEFDEDIIDRVYTVEDFNADWDARMAAARDAPLGSVDVGGKGNEFDGPATYVSSTPGGGLVIIEEVAVTPADASTHGGVSIEEIHTGKPDGKVVLSAHPLEDAIKEANRLATAVREGLITGVPGDLGPGGASGGGQSNSTNAGHGSDSWVGHGTSGSDSGKGSGSDGGHGTSKGEGKESGKGEGKEGGKGSGTDDGKGSGTDDGKDPKPTKGDNSTPDPDGAGGDGNASGRGLFRPGQAPSLGSGPDPDLDRLGRLGRLGDLGGGPGQTGGRGVGEPDLDTNSGGDIGAAHPGTGGRLAPSEGVGTDTGDPVA
jgi:hypothetical protein